MFIKLLLLTIALILATTAGYVDADIRLDEKKMKFFNEALRWEIIFSMLCTAGVVGEIIIKIFF